MKCQVINFPNMIIWRGARAGIDLKPAAGENKALPDFASEYKCGMKCQVINFPNVII